LNNQYESDEPRRHRTKRRSGTKILLWILGVCGVLAILICGGAGFLVYRLLTPTSFPAQTEDYVEARKQFRTLLARRGPAPQPGGSEVPPPGAKEVEYQSGDLRLRAWMNETSSEPRKPAILYLHGGFAFGLEDWEQAQPFRDGGFVVMMPILRGENGQPGAFTMFYDEVDDVLAAAEALRAMPEVDPNRLYVAGHSVGGTLALLAAMSSNRFRAAASFSGSPDQVAFARGQPELVPFDQNDPREFQMRSPLAFPRSFKCPVRLYYGNQEFFFRSSSQELARQAKSSGLDVEAVSVPGDHMSAVPEAMRQCIEFFNRKARE
jgi:dipeptidyl aminopeptidase/acylaminoacyl peptidase